MKSRDFERIRSDVSHGWELSPQLIESPYVKGKGPLTAQFNHVRYENGEKFESRIETPNMVALQIEELVNGRKARIHDIPPALIEKAKRMFDRATMMASPTASNDDRKFDADEPQVQMAASMPQRSMVMGG